jgi:putative FmdB family regulatory protein
MPLFAFACKSCGSATEILVRGGEVPACPQCASTDLEKQMSRFAPVHASAPEPMGCGAAQCCRMQGGGCMN